MLKHQREGVGFNRNKSDYRDATMAAELLHSGRFVEVRALALGFHLVPEQEAAVQSL